MFEKYGDSASNVVFLARYEAVQMGGESIQSEHFLLALVRECPRLMEKLLKKERSDLRVDIEESMRKDGKITGVRSRNIDVPLSPEVKTILAHVWDDFQRNELAVITPRELLAGILRHKECWAAKFLLKRGLNPGDVPGA